MWCPDGYFSWNTVLMRLFQTTEEVLSLVALGGTPRTKVNDKPQLIHTVEYYLRSQGFASSDEEAELNTALTTCFLMSKFLEDYPPKLANLTGQFITLEGVFFEHRDQLHNCQFGWPLRSQPEFSKFFDYVENGNFEPLSIFDRFAFIDSMTGELRLKNGAQLFLDNQTGYRPEDTAGMIEIVKKLKGFVICWETLPDESEFRNFLSYLEVDDTFKLALDHAFGPAGEPNEPPPDAPKRPIGRPSKRGLASRAYWELFPLGHERAGLAWKAAHLSVEEAVGFNIDITTLKRAVRRGGQKG